MLTGSAAELPLIERIAADIANPRAVIAPAPYLAHLPALMARMSALVTPDTGAFAPGGGSGHAGDCPVCRVRLAAQRPGGALENTR